MHLLLFDNYDSFTYNLVQLFRELLPDGKIEVFQNDRITLEEVTDFDAVVLSPGPGLPAEAGIMLSLIREYAKRKPILGICLGHQAIAEVFGARLLKLQVVWHGRASHVHPIKPEEKLFESLPKPFLAGRYHSWVVDEQSLPDCLEPIARSSDGYLMALRHKKYPLCGLQFHPESILTQQGAQMLKNWLKSIQSQIEQKKHKIAKI